MPSDKRVSVCLFVAVHGGAVVVVEGCVRIDLFRC